MRLLPLTLGLGFASFGITVGIAGPLVPLLRADIPMSFGQAGLFLAGSYLGQLAVVPAGGLADRFGRKAFLLVASALTAAGLLATALAPSFPVLLAASVLGGAGIGGYEVGLNALQTDVDTSSAAMNRLHLFFGVGAIAGPSLAGLVLRNGASWRAGFAAAAALPLLVFLLFAVQRIPASRASLAAGRAVTSPFKSGALWLFGLGVAAYVGLEIAIVGWLASWWKERGALWLAAPVMPSVFWITLTVGRLVAGRVGDRIGVGRFLVVSSALIAAVGAVWALVPSPAVALAAALLLGLFCAGVFPTAVVAATAAVPGRAGEVVGFMVFFSAVGGFAAPALVGRLADRVGMAALPAVVAVLGVVALLAFRPPVTAVRRERVGRAVGPSQG